MHDSQGSASLSASAAVKRGPRWPALARSRSVPRARTTRRFATLERIASGRRRAQTTRAHPHTNVTQIGSSRRAPARARLKVRSDGDRTLAQHLRP